MGRKINWNEVYQSRLDEIEQQIIIAVRKKQWSVKKRLEAERDKVKSYIDQVANIEKAKEVK